MNNTTMGAAAPIPPFLMPDIPQPIPSTIVPPKLPVPPTLTTSAEKTWTKERIEKVVEIGKLVDGSGKKWKKIAIEFFGPNQTEQELNLNAKKCKAKFEYMIYDPSKKDKIYWDDDLDQKLKDLANKASKRGYSEWPKISKTLFGNSSFATKCRHRYTYISTKPEKKK